MLHTGIDLHKRTIAVATVTPDGQAVPHTELPTPRAAVRAYFDALPGAAARSQQTACASWRAATPGVRPVAEVRARAWRRAGWSVARALPDHQRHCLWSTVAMLVAA